jgi:exodeoxyribonuclease VII large subunit
LIVGRGGGSIEDLWAFNEEIVAQAIFASKIPVVSAVGHEIDFTIADLVADARAPTPSASAEICSPDRIETARAIDSLANRATNAMHSQTETLNIQLRHLQARLQHPGRRLEQFHQRIDELMQRLPLSVATGLKLRIRTLEALRARVQSSNPRHRVGLSQSQIADIQRRLIASASLKIVALQSRVDENLRALQAVSPQATLRRGYAIVTNAAGEIGRDANQFTVGEQVSATLAQGQLNLTVDNVESDKPPGR